MEQIGNYIAGELVPPADGRYLDNVEPATGAVYSQVPASDREDVGRAVRAARSAFPGWSALAAVERSRLLLNLAVRIEADAARFAEAESRDTGKPVRLAQTLDIPRAISNLRFFATAILHEQGESHQTDQRALNFTLRQPRGVAGCISPWNLPLYLFTWKIAPALATGNTVVGKPSELTPMTAHRLSEICIDAGLPAGVLNIVHGPGATAGAAIVAHPEVGTISFTGGTRTGAEIGRVAAPMFKKISLELGGKNPTLVFADADLDEAVAESLRAAFSNQGEICLCGSRILVEKQVYSKFVERFVDLAGRLRVGDPLEPETDQGALVSRAHQEKVLSYIALAREEGGKVLLGGGVPGDLPERCRDGFFVQPTVITELDPGCRVMQEEIFGPVVSLTPFRDEAEALAIANGTPYGLASSIWTRDLARAHRVSARIESGIVWVNCWMLRDLRTPFGGVKQSGVGREGGVDALRFFTEPKNVCIRLESG